MAWKQIASVNVSYDPAYKHYIPSQFRVTGTLSASGLTDSTYYYFYASNLTPSGGVPARNGRNVSVVYSSNTPWIWSDLYFGPAETYTDVTISNPAVTVSAWGSKATPRAYLSKTSGFLDPANPEIITAKVTNANSAKTYGKYTVASGTCYYKKTSEGSYSSFAFTGDQIDLSGRLVGNETYEVYVVETVDDGTTATSDTYTFTTVDAVPTVTPVSPVNMITYGTVDFSWNYSTSTGTQQYAFDLEVSDDGNTWTTLKSHEVSSATSCTETVSGSGQKYWRVRGYNQDDVASSWSSAAMFVNYVNPDPPTDVNVSGTGRITVSWSASDQIAFEVMVGEYDSGWIYSSDTSYFVNEYLPNGSYPVKVRIINTLGLPSDWEDVEFTQSMVVTEPTATVTMMEGYNKIDIDAGSFDYFYVLRNGVPVAKTESGMYLDYFCNGEDIYTIRGIMSDDTFADLELIGAYVCRKPALISRAQNILYVNERLDEEPKISSSKTLDVATVQYLGRRKPVHHIGTMLTRTWAVSCSRDIEVGETYFYRNFRGDKAWVICSNVQSALNSLGVHEYSFTLEETDFSEGIEYEL